MASWSSLCTSGVQPAPRIASDPLAKRHSASIGPDPHGHAAPARHSRLVVGANDVNSAAPNSPASLIYGMPIPNVYEAQNVVFLKRSTRPGFSGSTTDVLYGSPRRSCYWATPKNR